MAFIGDEEGVFPFFHGREQVSGQSVSRRIDDIDETVAVFVVEASAAELADAGEKIAGQILLDGMAPLSGKRDGGDEDEDLQICILCAELRRGSKGKHGFAGSGDDIGDAAAAGFVPCGETFSLPGIKIHSLVLISFRKQERPPGA